LTTNVRSANHEEHSRTSSQSDSVTADYAVLPVNRKIRPCGVGVLGYDYHLKAGVVERMHTLGGHVLQNALNPRANSGITFEIPTSKLINNWISWCTASAMAMLCDFPQVQPTAPDLLHFLYPPASTQAG